MIVMCVSVSCKAAGKFDADIVQRQLRYTGMLATVQIRQAGYNYRLTFEVSLHVWLCLTCAVELSAEVTELKQFNKKVSYH